MSKFFITGLPRSRTAWLASFFTGNNSFCYHEILRVSSGFDDAIRKLSHRKEMYVGNSDSSLPIWIDKIDHIINQFIQFRRKILIKRSPKEYLEKR